MSRILIFGATGFIGSNLTRYFLKEGNEIHILIRKSSDFWRLNDISDEINTWYGDLTSPRSLRKLVGSCKPEIIINAAGVVRGFNLEDQQSVIDSNFKGTVNLMNVLESSGTEFFLNTGSAYEYGYGTELLEESYQGDPIGLYGITRKASSEYVRQVARKYKKRAFTLRLFTPYGSYDSIQRLIPSTIVRLLSGLNVSVKTPSSLRNFTYIGDICSAYKIILKNADRLDYGDIVNVGSGKPMTVKSVVQNILKFGFDPEKVNFGSDVSSLESDSITASVKRLKSLGWKQSFKISDGLSLTIDWYKKNLEYLTDKFKVQVSEKSDTL